MDTPIAADGVIAERDAWFGADVIDPLVAGWVACEQQTVPSADHFFAATTDDVADRAVGWAVAQADGGAGGRSGDAPPSIHRKLSG